MGNENVLMIAHLIRRDTRGACPCDGDGETDRTEHALPFSPQAKAVGGLGGRALAQAQPLGFAIASRSETAS